MDKFTGLFVSNLLVQIKSNQTNKFCTSSFKKALSEVKNKYKKIVDMLVEKQLIQIVSDNVEIIANSQSLIAYYQFYAAKWFGQNGLTNSKEYNSILRKSFAKANFIQKL